jgi:hypothetical protein
MNVVALKESTQSSTLLRVRIECEGRSPLLMNKMSEEVLLSLRPGHKLPKSSRPTTTPREEAQLKAYLDENGDAYIPIGYFFSACVIAGQSVRLDGKRQISTAKATVLPAFLSFEDQIMALIDPKTGKPAQWEVDVRQGRNPGGGEAVCICRPRFDRWSFTVHGTIDTHEIAESKIRELIDIAGARVGIGDFRPNRKGWFGKFGVKCWERL